MHRALELFVKKFPRELPADAAAKLVEIADEVFREIAVPKAALALWRPRFLGAANLVRGGRAQAARGNRAELCGDQGEAQTQGTRRRIHACRQRRSHRPAESRRRRDYSTTRPARRRPTSKCSSICRRNCRWKALCLRRAVLRRSTRSPRRNLSMCASPAARTPARSEPSRRMRRRFRAMPPSGLPCRIARFDDESTAYYSRVAPYRADIAGDYDHLARVREWSLSGWRGGRRMSETHERLRSRIAPPGWRPMPARARPTPSPIA